MATGTKQNLRSSLDLSSVLNKIMLKLCQLLLSLLALLIISSGSLASIPPHEQMTSHSDGFRDPGFLIQHDDHSKLTLYLNKMYSDGEDELLMRMQIGGKENSLSKMLMHAWNRGWNLEFKSSQMPIYLYCRKEGDRTLHRRGGLVLEAVAPNIRTERLEKKKWLALFIKDATTGYYLDYLKDIQTIVLEGPGSEITPEEPEILIDSVYNCSSRQRIQYNYTLQHRLEELMTGLENRKEYEL